jgi:hypothetical protein
MVHAEHGDVAEGSQPPGTGVQAGADQNHLRAGGRGHGGGQRVVDHDGAGYHDLRDGADHLHAHPGRGASRADPQVLPRGCSHGADRRELVLPQKPLSDRIAEPVDGKATVRSRASLADEHRRPTRPARLHDHPSRPSMDHLAAAGYEGGQEWLAFNSRPCRRRPAHQTGRMAITGGPPGTLERRILAVKQLESRRPAAQRGPWSGMVLSGGMSSNTGCLAASATKASTGDCVVA